MLKFALKNMAIKKVQIILVVLSIVISAGIGVLAFNVATQVEDGITSGVGNYGVIIGPAGSKTQLAMNTMYFAEEPVGTIPYDVVVELQNNPQIRSAIPFAMADNYNGRKVVGTTPEYLEEKILSEGKMFDSNETMQAVVGARVAKENELKIGDTLHIAKATVAIIKNFFITTNKV